MGHLTYVEETHPAQLRLAEKLEKEIALAIARDILVGVDATGIRAGLIGEVGGSWPLANTERKILSPCAADDGRSFDDPPRA